MKTTAAASDLILTDLGDGVTGIAHKGAGAREVRISANGDGFWILSATVSPGVASTQAMRSQPSRARAIKVAGAWLARAAQ